jgi:hypothetical protein
MGSDLKHAFLSGFNGFALAANDAVNAAREALAQLVSLSKAVNTLLGAVSRGNIKRGLSLST